MLMPFEWDVRVSSKDHTVTAFTSATTQTTTVALHHYARLNFDGRLRLLEVHPNLTSEPSDMGRLAPCPVDGSDALCRQSRNRWHRAVCPEWVS